MVGSYHQYRGGGGAAVPVDVVRKGDLFINIQDYGAVGDGVADDTDAIDDALAAAAAAGGGTVYVPRGEYLTDGGHTIPAYCHLVGVETAGRYWTYNAVAMPPTSCAFRLRTGTAAAAMLTIAAGATAFSISSLSLLGGHVGSGIHGMVFADPSQEHNLIVENVAVIGFSGDGIRGRLFGARLTNLFVASNQGWGLHNNGTNRWTDAWFTGCIIAGNVLGGLNFASTGANGEICFTNCRFERSGWDPANPGTPVATNSPGIRIAGNLSTSAFIGCSTDANSGHGLEIVRSSGGVSMHHITFTACRFNRDGYGTMVGGTGPDRAAVKVAGTSGARIGYISFSDCITTEGKADDAGGEPDYAHPRFGLWLENTDYVTWHGGGVSDSHPGAQYHGGGDGWGSNWRPSLLIAGPAGQAVLPVWETATRPPVALKGGIGYNEQTGNPELFNGSEWAAVNMTAAHPGHRSVIFYAPPQIVNGLHTDEGAAQTFSSFDQVVFGSGLEDPLNAYYASTGAIIARIGVLNPRATVFGYVDMGFTAPSIGTMQTAVDRWVTLGVHGIFFDTVEYAYGVSRATMNTMVNYCHAAGLSTIINGFQPDDVMGSAVNATYNPAGTPTAMDERDWYLAESLVVNTDAYTANDGYATFSDIRTRLELCRAYRASLGVRIMATGIVDFSAYPAATIDQYWGVHQAACLAWGVDSWGLSPPQYSATGPGVGVVRSLPYWSRRDVEFKPTATPTINGGNTEAYRPDLGVVVHVDTSTSDYRYRYIQPTLGESETPDVEVPQWTPEDHNLKGWTMDPAGLAAVTGTITAGVVQLARVKVRRAGPVTNIHLYVTAAGVSLTTGQCFAALYDAVGVKLATTADQATAWQSTGPKTMALAGGPFNVPPGDYYIAMWANGSTPPGFQAGTLLSLANIGLAAPNLRNATADTGITTTGPATLGTQTAANIGWWAGLS